MASSSSFSNQSNQKTGGTWTKKLYFDPEADKHPKEEHTFPDDELQATILNLTTSINQRKITRVQVYTAAHQKTWKDHVPFLKHGPDNVPWTEHVPFLKHSIEHIFLVVTVGQDSWFSLELNNGGITIQQSQNIDGVTKFGRNRLRINVGGPKQDVKHVRNEVTFDSLLEWVQTRSEEWRHSNCHDFASKVFTYVTKTTLKIAKPEEVCGDELIPEENGKYYAYFTPEANIENVSSKYWITDDQLQTLLQEHVDSDEKIKTVSAFKTPLYEKQWTFRKLYHLFIVFETDSWWWSIEKNDEGLTIQRSKTQNAVRDNYRQTPRLKKDRWFLNWEVTLEQSDTGNKTIKELINWLEDKQWLYHTYHLTSSNCQHFGKAVFDYVSKSGILKIAT